MTTEVKITEKMAATRNEQPKVMATTLDSSALQPLSEEDGLIDSLPVALKRDESSCPNSS